MAKGKHFLAKAIGSSLARRSGLQGITLPRCLPTGFIRVLVDAANETRKQVAGVDVYAIVIADPKQVPAAWKGLTAVTSEETARYRTKTASGGGSCLVVSYAGDFKLLKTLEAFREVFPQGVPFGDARNGVDLSASEIAQALSEEILAASRLVASAVEKDNLSETIEYVLGYLCDAYSSYGNEMKTWIEAWWMHADAMVDELVSVSARLSRTFRPGGLEYLVFASAGLPRPDKGKVYQPSHQGKRFASEVNSRFDSQDMIMVSLADMAVIAGEHGRPAAPHELEKHVNWDNFQQSRTATGHGLLAFTRHDTSDPIAHMKGWAGTFEVDFFGASKQAEKTLSLSVDGMDLYAHQAWSTGVYLYTYPRSPIVDSEIDLGPLVIRIPFHGGATKADFSDEVLDRVHKHLVVSPKSLTLDLEGRKVVEDGVELHLRMRTKQPKKWRTAPFKLTWSAGAGAGLQHLLESGCSASLILPVPDGATFILSVRGKKKINIAHATPEEPPVAFTLKSDDNVNIAFCFDQGAYGSEANPEGTIPLAPVVLSGSPCATSVYEAIEYAPVEDDCASVDTTEFILSIEFSGERPWLPLIATACKLSPRKEIPNAFGDDLRAQLERDWLRSAALQTAGGSIHPSGFCQAFLAIEGNEGSADLEDRGGWFAPASLDVVPLETAGAPHIQGKTLAALDAFRSAYAALGLEYLSRSASPDGSEIMLWPSQLSFKNLSNEQVSGYLGAYADLLSAARDEKGATADANVFWCTYPFSLFLVSGSEARGQLTGVMLSPLHPLRLGWLWSVEKALSGIEDEDHRKGLLQFVEGWNFPFLGPHFMQFNKPLVAMPLSAGDEHLFAGWAFLSGNIEKHKLTAPAKVGSTPFPAGASSGLNGGGVAAAAKDFLRVHAYLSTLNVDLGAYDRVARCPELDSAVINELLAVASRDKPGDLPGGVRVYDSANRVGSPPDRDRIMRLLGDSEDSVPLQWNVYKGAGPSSDIRFVQDAVTQVEIEQATSDELPAGMSGPLPIKRYWTAFSRRAQGSGGVRFNPSIDTNGGELPAFFKALSLVESQSYKGRHPSSIETWLNVPGLGSESTWTVTGNATLSPATIADGLKLGAGKRRMLWEWRPSYLPPGPGSGRLGIDKRPYTTIATIPGPFENSLISGPLARIKQNPEKADVDRVVELLGTRGIGLSSLLAIGHNHATGAVGFYLAYRCAGAWEAAAELEKNVRFTLPVDAIDPLLRLIAGRSSGAANDLKRADLLLLDCEIKKYGVDITIVPVEIKLYDHSATSIGFASDASSSVKDALGQLDSTLVLLEKVVGSGADGLDSSTNAFTTSAVTALVETAILFSRSEDDIGVRSTLSAVARGCAKLRVGGGLLCWFQSRHKNANGDGVELSEGSLAKSSRRYARVSIDPATQEPAFWGDEPASADNSAIRCFRDAVSKCVAPQNLTNVGKGTGSASSTETTEVDEASEDTATIHFYTVPEAEAEAKDEVDVGTGIDGDDSVGGGQPVAKSWSPVNLLIGEKTAGFETQVVQFCPSDTRVTQLNMGVVGNLGTGKTQFLKSLLYQFARSKGANRGVMPKFLIFDYNEDYTDESFLSEIGGKVIQPYDIPLNFFDTSSSRSPKPQLIRSEFFTSTIARIFGGIGPIQQKNLRSAILEAYELDAKFPTIYDVALIYEKKINGKADAVSSVMDTLTQFEIFERNPDKVFNFEELFSGTIVINLKQLGAGNLIKTMLVTIFLNYYLEYMLNRKKQPYLRDDSTGLQHRFIDSFLVVDEANNVVSYDFPVLEEILLQGRKYGVGVILSTQYLSHFNSGSMNYAEPLNTWFIHQVPQVTKNELSNLGFTEIEDSGGVNDELVASIRQLPPHFCLFKNGPKGAVIRGKPYFELLSGD